MNINDIDGSELSQSELEGEIRFDYYPEDDPENYPAVLTTNHDVYYYENQTTAMDDEERIEDEKLV